jgi:hypothetical protein
MTGEHMHDDAVLTVDEVTHLLNVHADTVRWWTDSSTLQCCRIEPRGDLALRVGSGNESGHRFTLPVARVGGITRGQENPGD